MRRLLLVLAVAVLPLAAAGTAAADQPATTTITVDTTFTNPVMSAFCGFPVQQSAVGEIRVTTFADGRVVQHRDLTISQSANGVTIVAKHQVTFFVENGERTSAGLVALFDLPDGRKFAADVGRLIVDLGTREVLFDAGRHDVLDGPIPGQATVLCPHLAAP
jgi:hypothetical protein